MSRLMLTGVRPSASPVSMHTPAAHCAPSSSAVVHLHSAAIHMAKAVSTCPGARSKAARNSSLIGSTNRLPTQPITSAHIPRTSGDTSSPPNSSTILATYKARAISSNDIPRFYGGRYTRAREQAQYAKHGVGMPRRLRAALWDRTVCSAHRRILCAFWEAMNVLYKDNLDSLALHYYSLTSQCLSLRTTAESSTVFALRRALGMPDPANSFHQAVARLHCTTSVPYTTTTFTHKPDPPHPRPDRIHCALYVPPTNKAPVWETKTERLVWVSALVLLAAQGDTALLAAQASFLAWTARTIIPF
ncbi:ORF48 [Ranid herpesvirus 1]|uniref:ORF48 n=1 Tax=Ranid herpesvirus 1 TaxID=85655 RepID=Q14VR0_9VIRU|nr:ORF48 [Ranid herpesvirus 1]ABG25763.1 ORF48 [Ranid herpesvirus 1]